MKLRDEFLVLIQDRWAWARNGVSISLPAIISVLLAIQGKPNVLIVGLYIFFFLLIVINSIYVLVVKDKEKYIFVGDKKKYSAKYPSLQLWAIWSLILTNVLTLAFIFLPPLNKTFVIVAYGTPTPTATLSPTPTQTLTITPSPTITLTPSPQPISDLLYYMIVLDASEKMNESFHGQSKWHVAVNTLIQIINGLNPRAHYGLVIVGGSNSSGLGDPCGDPSTPAIPFSNSNMARETVWNHVGNLQPQGGGSFYRAFTLAKTQLEDLSRDKIRTLIYITGSSDNCETEDEWNAMKNIVDIPDTTVGIFSQIIILDNNGLKSQTLADKFNSLSKNVNAQAPQTIQDVQDGVTIVNVVKNVNIFVENEIVARATDIPSNPNLTFTPSSTLTPITGFSTPPSPTSVLIILPTNTLTAIPPTPIPPPSATLAPFVEILSYSYLQTGIGCQADITVRVSGSDAKGSFHVWNASYQSEGDIYPPTTLQVGTYSGYLVTLGGLEPQYYRHDVWFEYNGTSSNRLTNLICPNLTPSP